MGYGARTIRIRFESGFYKSMISDIIFCLALAVDSKEAITPRLSARRDVSPCTTLANHARILGLFVQSSQVNANANHNGGEGGWSCAWLRSGSVTQIV